MLQLALIFGLAAVFFVVERVVPGRQLPEAPGWYARAVCLNACRLAIVVLAGVTWNRWLQGGSLLHVGALWPPAV